ncbi:DEAD/DEAH box helicase [Lysinibacillus fusiformis]|uniref:Helicase conserved C-terminal domain-containing protein n=1 Tax=Lysinibacillus fusiformis TaxID=28031 RepID=A0A1E4QYJ5_9BACI|nr:DEAD/DEAH box helicase [Lysinibacillus fusiformis]ODV53284.1 hypothetical protein BG258_23570 [Lysinibacillus fusiformis]
MKNKIEVKPALSLINIEKVDDRYKVTFAGKRHQFNEYINKVMMVEEKDYDIENKAWFFDEDGIKVIKSLFKVPEKPTAIPVSIKKEVSGYESMGKNLKLQPYEYQKEAIKYIVDTHETLLILPCGAGKSCTGIGAYLELKERGKVSGPGMIIVKASLKYQWHKEVEKFSDLKSKVVLSSKEVAAPILTKIKRRENTLKKLLKNNPKDSKVTEIQKEIINLKKESIKVFKDQFKEADLFVLNYETLREKDVSQELRQANVEYIFADEVQYIKSKDSKRSKAVSEFSDVPYKVGATATPVGKNPEDLYGIFRFVSPETFPKWGNFSALYIKYAGYGKVVGFKNLDKLREKIAPSLFIKSKEEVANFLPKLVVMQRYCEFEPAQRKMYINITQKIDELKEQEKAIRANFKTEGDSLNNPELAKVEALILAHQTFAQQLANSEELFTLSESEMASQFITGAKSNKMEILVELVEEIISSGEKVAIYSRFKKMQDIIIKRFAKEFPDVKIAQIHGGFTSEERYEEAYTKFRDNDNFKVLLASNAGAEGINLSHCKYLIEIEPAESYAIQTQRHGRLERSDSIHDTVFVYQLICNDSWDEVALKIVTKKEAFDIKLIRE